MSSSGNKIPFLQELIVEPKFQKLLDECQTDPNLKLSTSTKIETSSSPPSKDASNPLFNAIRSSQPTILQVHGPTINPSNQAEANLTLTENFGVTHATTEYAPLDLFHTFTSPIKPEDAEALLVKSWDVNPLETLKLIWNVRSVGEGKGEAQTFFRGLGFLRERHPMTLARNLEEIVRPVSLKLAKKKNPEEMDVDFVKVEGEKGKEEEEEEINPATARSHGYYKVRKWKLDLINLIIAILNSDLDFVKLGPSQSPGLGFHRRTQM
jgi:hypothetical protein